MLVIVSLDKPTAHIHMTMVATGNFVASSNVALLQCQEDSILESLAPLLQVRELGSLLFSVKSQDNLNLVLTGTQGGLFTRCSTYNQLHLNLIESPEIISKLIQNKIDFNSVSYQVNSTKFGKYGKQW